MNGRSFFDSNVLVYSDDKDNPAKQAIALELLEQGRLTRKGVVSTQVLQEYFVSVIRKLSVPTETARRKVELFSRFDLVTNQLEDILTAIDLQRLHQTSFWDALILRAALRSNCSRLYSEDLQSGRKINGLEIVNPFV
ncbi:MAG TPA: PIN domain-containing protein [Thermoanaerobaculia bacterium]|jgi:predicted nucleic acid-binding protein|nr:PIN domain-containing protein [Thermoanaerobaculia bacterium]